MKTLLFVDATIRPEEASRTWQLCRVYLEEWKKHNPDGVIEHLRLRDEDLHPNLAEDIELREKLLSTHSNQPSPHPLMQYSRQFANADRILIGAPYWDLSFPSMLRIYIEKLCIPGITFCYTEQGVKPLCQASDCVYLTTCGGDPGRNLGAQYIHELCDVLFGIETFYNIGAEGLDIEGADVESIMAQAENEVRNLVRMQQEAIKIRPMKPEEYPCLEQFLYDAIYLPCGSEMPSEEITNQPELAIYIRDFGQKDDACLVAEAEGTLVGAVWTRILSGEVKGYGNLDEYTPEFAISVKKEFRGQGIGTKLMRKMIELLKERGYEKTSLSVNKDNYAHEMYRKLGFQDRKMQEEDCLMVLNLTEM